MAKSVVKSRILPLFEEKRMNTVLDFIKSPAMWISLGIIILTFFIYRLLKRSENKTIKTISLKHDENQREVTQLRIVCRFVRYLVVIAAVLVLLQVNGIDVSSIITGLGIAGIIVGFALQDLLKDIIMGVSIITRGFLKISDVIEYESGFWEITDISLRFLYLRNIDSNEMLILGNRNISEIKIQTVYQDIVVPGNYSVPAEKMRDICDRICRKADESEKIDKCIFIGTDSFMESQISYKIRVYNKPADRDNVRRMVNGIIQDVLSENRIDIPFNQLDVHIKTEDMHHANHN